MEALKKSRFNSHSSNPAFFPLEVDSLELHNLAEAQSAKTD